MLEPGASSGDKDQAIEFLQQSLSALIFLRNMLRSLHGHDAQKVKTPHAAAAHGFAARAVARAGAAAGAALGAGFAQSQGARANPP